MLQADVRQVGEDACNRSPKAGVANILLLANSAPGLGRSLTPATVNLVMKQ